MNKEDLKVGDYVRTKKGIIGKIITIGDKIITIGMGYVGIKFNDDACFVEKEDIITASDNILDLLAPMDLMYIDVSPDDCGGIVVPRIAETLNELEKLKERIMLGECILKGIVTKELLEQNTYRVGE